MSNLEITIDNICEACERKPMGGCEEPCDIWYQCLQGVPIKIDDLLAYNRNLDKGED